MVAKKRRVQYRELYTAKRKAFSAFAKQYKTESDLNKQLNKRRSNVVAWRERWSATDIGAVCVACAIAAEDVVPLYRSYMRERERKRAEIQQKFTDDLRRTKQRLAARKRRRVSDSTHAERCPYCKNSERTYDAAALLEHLDICSYVKAKLNAIALRPGKRKCEHCEKFTGIKSQVAAHQRTCRRNPKRAKRKALSPCAGCALKFKNLKTHKCRTQKTCADCESTPQTAHRCPRTLEHCCRRCLAGNERGQAYFDTGRGLARHDSVRHKQAALRP